MEFAIQASSPRTSGERNFEDETLEHCVETSFLMDSESAYMQWMHIHIPLPYKYCISELILDILVMLERLLNTDTGEITIAWPCNEFRTDWAMSWKGGVLTIKATWDSVIGGTEAMLNKTGALQIDKAKFIYEWKTLLETVINGLTDCGYSESDISEFPKLKTLHSRIEAYGILYR